MTLLSKTESTGPHSAYNGDSSYARYSQGDKEYDIWSKFVSYEDKDGFYFLQFFQECNRISSFTWGYYPPDEFKILIYFPQKDSFAVSTEVYERYAFDSYYTVDITNHEIQTVNKNIQANRTYNYSLESGSFIARVIITIIIEILFAFLFGFNLKKQLIAIGIVNIVTQIVLNIMLNTFNYSNGYTMYIIIYVLLEILVFAIEAAIYYFVLNKFSNKTISNKWTAVIYALVANAASFVIGLGVSYFIPDIF